MFWAKFWMKFLASYGRDIVEMCPSLYKGLMEVAHAIFHVSIQLAVSKFKGFKSDSLIQTFV